MKHARSIRVKLITLYAGLLTLLFLGLGAYTYLGFRQFLIRELQLSVERRAHQIALTIVRESTNHRQANIGQQIKTWYQPELNERAIRITDSNHQTLYASDNVDRLTDPFSGITPEKTGVGPPVYRKEINKNGEVLCVVALNCLLDNGTVYTVEVGAPDTEMTEALNSLLVVLAIGFPILIGLSVLGGYFLLGRALRPVNEIVNAAERITFKNLSERLPVPRTGDEFEQISEALNRMINRLDEAFQVATRFSADASHELRTPLTVVRGELEVFVQKSGLSAESADHAAEILEELERLSKIVEGLLLVSSLEAGEAQMKFEVIDLGRMVESVADQMQLLGEDKFLKMKREIAPEITVEGDLRRLEQVTVNLLDNAIKYTPEGGSILLSVRAEKGRAIFEVIDTGIGISPAAQPYIFKRFFRAKEVKATRSEGVGLGLAIVQSIAEAHGGSVSVENNEPAGTKMRVELPLQASERKANVEHRIVA